MEQLERRKLMNTVSAKLRYHVTGMDCSSCAAKIETAARKVQGVADVKVSLATQMMTVIVDDPARQLPALEKTVADLGYRLAPEAETATLKPGAALNMQNAMPVTQAYKRALWIVVVLNVGYGVVQVIGSVLADSQAVQADALDFIGDGVISLLGLAAVSWTLAARARAALLQGSFLLLMSFGVIGTTLYRVFVDYEPQTVLMGTFALGAFAVNVLAAMVLLPHRNGDANMKAVWLFSRNDALGNLAVLVAAVLVWLLSSPWPDLFVAFVVASLFLHSAWSILLHARSDLAQAKKP